MIVANRANEEIKALLKSKGLFYWQVAEQLGVSESTLLRWMRTEFTADRKAKIEAAIEAMC